jgi:hypothetical protein
LNIKRFSLFFVIILVFFQLSGSTLNSVLPNFTIEQINVINNNEMIKGASFEDNLLNFVPKSSIAEDNLKLSLNKPDSFTVISLILIPYPEKMKSMSDKEKQLEIFNTMRSISTQEGITYISHRAGNKPKILIEKSWYLETPKSRSSLKDPISTSVPQTAEYYVYQRDSSFGNNIYQHNYKTSGKEIFVKVINLETIRVFSIFKAVNKEQLEIAMDTYLLDEGILLTAMATIEGRDPQIKVLGITVDLPSAFSRRTTALGEWFVEQLIN